MRPWSRLEKFGIVHFCPCPPCVSHLSALFVDLRVCVSSYLSDFNIKLDKFGIVLFCPCPPCISHLLALFVDLHVYVYIPCITQFEIRTSVGQGFLNCWSWSIYSFINANIYTHAQNTVKPMKYEHTRARVKSPKQAHKVTNKPRSAWLRRTLLQNCANPCSKDFHIICIYYRYLHLFFQILHHSNKPLRTL